MLVDGLQTPSEWETASRIVGKEPPVTEWWCEPSRDDTWISEH